jgi:hypothetical protein
MRRWLDRDVELPAWALLAAAALFAATIGWAMSTHASLDEARAQLADRATPSDHGAAVAPIELRGDQFRPASWQPGEEGTYR